MGDITKGYTFTAGEVVTPAKLHALVENSEIKAASVGTTEIADGAVTQAKLASGIAVTASQVTLASGKVLVGNGSNVGAEVTVDTGTMTTVGAVGVKALGIATAQLADGAVTTAKVADGAVTLAKVANIATARVLGRTTAGSGVVEELSAGTGISIAGGTIASTVTGITKGTVVTVGLSSGVTGIIYTGSHGLAAMPFEVSLKLKCLTAEHGYAVGQYVNAGAAIYDGSDYDVTPFWWTATASTLKLGRYEPLGGGSTIRIPNATTGAQATLTDANWALEATAWI